MSNDNDGRERERDERRAPPQSTVQAAGQVATDVVRGMSGQPMLLGLMVLNAIGIAAALWFLQTLIEGAQKNMNLLLRSCIHQPPPI
jgi:hypothetical protein